MKVLELTNYSGMKIPDPNSGNVIATVLETKKVPCTVNLPLPTVSKLLMNKQSIQLLPERSKSASSVSLLIKDRRQ